MRTEGTRTSLTPGASRCPPHQYRLHRSCLELQFRATWHSRKQLGPSRVRGAPDPRQTQPECKLLATDRRCAGTGHLCSLPCQRRRRRGSESAGCDTHAAAAPSCSSLHRHHGYHNLAGTIHAWASSPASAMSCSHVRYLRRCGSGSLASGQPSASRSRHRSMQTSSSQTTGEAHGGLQHSWSAYGSASKAAGHHTAVDSILHFLVAAGSSGHPGAHRSQSAGSSQRPDAPRLALGGIRHRAEGRRTQPLAQRETAFLPECPPLMSFLDVIHVVLRR